MDYKVVSGVPFLEISRYAGEQDTDMIVMGSRGRSGLGHLLIGSVAERVLRKAHCPVLTVKERVKTSKLEEEEEEQVSTLCSYALSKAEEQAAAVSLTNISSSILPVLPVLPVADASYPLPCRINSGAGSRCDVPAASITTHPALKPLQEQASASSHVVPRGWPGWSDRSR